MLQHRWLDAALVGVMIIGLIGYLWHRMKTQMGIGARGIQFVGVCLLILGVLILALECRLSECSAGTIVGAFAGYLFSGLSSFEKKEEEKPTASPAG